MLPGLKLSSIMITSTKIKKEKKTTEMQCKKKKKDKFDMLQSLINKVINLDKYCNN